MINYYVGIVFRSTVERTVVGRHSSLLIMEVKGFYTDDIQVSTHAHTHKLINKLCYSNDKNSHVS